MIDLNPRTGPRHVVAALLAVVLATPVAMAADRLRLDLGISLGNLTGDYTTTTDADLFSLDLERDLDVGSSPDAPYARLAMQLSRRNRLVIDWVKASDDARTDATIPVTVEGIPLSVDATLKSSFEFSAFRLAYGYPVVASDALDIQLELGTQLVKARGSITATDRLLGLVAVRRSDDRSEIGPVLGVDLHFRPASRFELSGHISYARLPLSGADIKYSDVEAAVAIRLFSSIWARGGLRDVKVDVDGGDYTFGLGLGGPFAGISLIY